MSNTPLPAKQTNPKTIDENPTDMIDNLPTTNFQSTSDLKLTDKLRQQMHEDLIDSYDEEIESEIDDYIQDLRYEGQPLTDSEKIDRHIYFKELIRLQKELIKLQDWVVATGERIVVIFEGRDSAGKVGLSNVSPNDLTRVFAVWQRCLRPMIEKKPNGIFSAMSPICQRLARLCYLTAVGTTVLGLNG